MKLGLYRHYKGGYYKVTGICLHSETKEELVLYESLNEDPMSKLWVRPVDKFFENVVVDGVKIPRFSYIGDQKAKERL